MSTIQRQFFAPGQDRPDADPDDEAGAGAPISVAEIEELVYGSDRPDGERLDRLREFRADLAGREAGDFGEGDPAFLISEIDRAIERLQPLVDEAEELVATVADLTALGHGQDHRVIASPEDDADGDDEDVLDPSEWDDGDGFDPGRGVH